MYFCCILYLICNCIVILCSSSALKYCERTTLGASEVANGPLVIIIYAMAGLCAVNLVCLSVCVFVILGIALVYYLHTQ